MLPVGFCRSGLQPLASAHPVLVTGFAGLFFACLLRCRALPDRR